MTERSVGGRRDVVGARIAQARLRSAALPHTGKGGMWPSGRRQKSALWAEAIDGCSLDIALPSASSGSKAWFRRYSAGRAVQQNRVFMTTSGQDIPLQPGCCSCFFALLMGMASLFSSSDRWGLKSSAIFLGGTHLMGFQVRAHDDDPGVVDALAEQVL